MRIGHMPFAERAAQAYRGDWLDPDPDLLRMQQHSGSMSQRERMPSSDAAISMLLDTAQTLTSLNLDWVYCAPLQNDTATLGSWAAIYARLFSCRFPHLRSFQWRNCVVPETRMPKGLYLLDSAADEYASYSASTCVKSTDLAGLEFMEAHPNLLCLAWPMEHFFSHRSSSPDVVSRVRSVVHNLGRSLTDLRVDTPYSGMGETNSEVSVCKDKCELH